MALTNDDKQWIKEAIVEGVNGALETIVLPRFDAVEADISELKRDVSELKEDVSGLKEDVSGLKEDVSGLKKNITSECHGECIPGSCTHRPSHHGSWGRPKLVANRLPKVKPMTGVKS